MEAEEVKEKFPNLFKGLGKLGDPDYLIKLKPDTKPPAIGTPGRVPVPLLSKVNEELSRNSSSNSSRNSFLKWLSQRNGAPGWLWSQKLMAKFKYTLI